MSEVFRKLNLKDHSEIHVLNAPASFEPELQALQNVAVKRSLDDSNAVAFSLAFVMTQSEVDQLAQAVAARAAGDSIVWFAYPKGSSPNYKSEINRDSGWKVLGECGFEPVRMVAIDADWSAVRFRRAEFIKTMTRGVEWTGSAVGREKAAASAQARKAKAPAMPASGAARRKPAATKAAGNRATKKVAGKKRSAKNAAARKAAATGVASTASARKAAGKSSRRKRHR